MIRKSMSSAALSKIDALTRRLAQEGISRPRVELPRQDFWVFGYGSLMWNPGFPHLDVKLARLYGYRRRFCVFSHRYRGTPECPGLVLGLDRGGSCWGLAYQVPRSEGEEVLAYLYEREMTTGVYFPRWLALEVKGRKKPLTALGFVVDPHHKQYAGHLREEEVTRLILQGKGQRGACAEYLRNTVRHLDALGLHDRALHRLLKSVEAR
jgi:cation transport protein ChaC